MRSAGVALALFLAAPSLTSAATYYVATTGNDNNSGLSLAQAWATVAKANRTLVPGDVCQLMSGSHGGIAPINSGTSSSRITYLGSLAAPTTTTVSSLSLAGRSYVSVKGFRVSSGSLSVPGSAQSDSIVNCVATAGGLTIGYGRNNVILGCTATTTGKLFLFDCQDQAVPDNAAQGLNNTIRQCTVTADEIAVRGVTTSTIDRCRFFLTIKPGAATDTHFFTAYVARSITFTDNFISSTNLTTTERRHFQFRDHTMLWNAARDTFIVGAGSTGAVAGIWATSGAYNHTYGMRFDRLFVKTTSNVNGVFTFQTDCEASSITNSVLVAMGSQRVMSIDGPDMDSLNFVHNTCVALGTPDRGVFVQDGSAESRRTVRHNIFYSNSSSNVANGAGIGYFHGPVMSTGNAHNHNLFFCRAGLGPNYATKHQYTYSAVGSGTSWNQTASRPDSSSRWGDPMFTDIVAATFNPTPRSGSAAVGSQWPDGYVGAVAVATGPDVTPPNAVSNLSVPTLYDNTVILAWAAPGDDGSSGTAASYEIRMSTTGPITAANFASATVVSPAPIPMPAGTAQTLVLGGLTPGTTYWFALRAVDEAGNVSAVSNSPEGTTPLVDTVPPAPINDLSATP